MSEFTRLGRDTRVSSHIIGEIQVLNTPGSSGEVAAGRREYYILSYHDANMTRKESSYRLT